MRALFSNLLTASVSGSIVILAVLVLRLVLRKTPKKFICMLWMVAGLRLLLPVPLQSRFSLQPPTIRLPQSETLQTYLVPLWCIVAVSLLCASLISYAHLRRQVKDARKIRGGWECEGLETAFVLGFLKPKIYIPAGVSDNTRQQILAHERTHLDKGDHWIKLIGFLALVLHWFNPLVWVSYILLCKDIEMACDQRVVQFMDPPERKAYSAALLDCSTHKVHYAACPVAFGEVSVKYRIKSVLSYKKPAFWMSLSGVLAIAFVAVCLGTNPVEKQEDPEAALVQSSQEDPADFSPAAQPQYPENPDWGITLSVEDLTVTGGKLILKIAPEFCRTRDTIKVSGSHLERWNGSSWEIVPVLAGNAELYPETNYGFSLGQDTTQSTYRDLDWSLTYGALSAGDYLIAMNISGEGLSGSFCVPFRIYREALPSAQEEALTRCTNTINALNSKSAISLLCGEKNAFNDDVSPTARITKDGQRYRLDYYAGEYLASSMQTDYNFADRMKDMLNDFLPDENRKILFPEGESCIDAQQIRFRSAWADASGTTYQGTDTYRFDETGNLTRVDRLVQDGSGTVLSHDYLEVLSQDYGVCVNYIADCASLDYADSFSTGADSPWNIFLRVDDDLLLPTGGEIMVSWQGVGRGSYTMDDRYWLEKKTSDGWQRLQGDNTYPFGTVLQPLSSMSQIFSLDWSSTYGALDSGVYRLGTRFYSGSESIIQYAQFAIGPTGGIHGAGAEEAMARVDAAIAKLKTASYHVKKAEGYPEHGELVQSEEILQYGGDLAVAIYNEGTYSHCFVDSGDDRLWDGWYNYSYYPGPYDSFYFPEGQSVISDNEITFLYSSSQASEDNPLTRCTYRFDEQGNITEIERDDFGLIWGGYVVRYTFLDTPESEIQQTVADMKNNDYRLFLP